MKFIARKMLLLIVALIMLAPSMSAVPVGPGSIPRDDSRVDPSLNETDVHDKKVTWKFEEDTVYTKDHTEVANKQVALEKIENWISGTDMTTGRAELGGRFQTLTHEVIIFGGTDWATNYNDTWGYNITTDQWVQKADGPTARHSHDMVVLRDAHKYCLVGGITGFGDYTTAMSDVWMYNIFGDSWQQVPDAPFAIADQAMEMRYTTDTFYLFGGANSTGYSNMVWRYDIPSGIWTSIATQGTPMPARAGATVTWHHPQSRFLIYGGYNGSTVFNDLWAFYPDNGTWAKVGTGASPRWQHAAIWDAVNQRMIVFGGKSTGLGSTSGYLKDLWAYYPITNSWAKLKDHTNTRANHIMFFISYMGMAYATAGCTDNGSPAIYKDMIFFNVTYASEGTVRGSYEIPVDPVDIKSVKWSGEVPDPGTRTDVEIKIWTSMDNLQWEEESLANEGDPVNTGRYFKWELKLKSLIDIYTPRIHWFQITYVVNNPPVANAGLDKSVNKGRVDLTGLATTDADDDWLEFYWTQLDGPEEVLLEPTNTSPAPHFDTSLAGNFSFQLDIFDGFVWDHDNVTINVKNKKPTVDTIETVTGTAMVPVELTATGKDPDGTIVRYDWRFGDGTPDESGQTVTHTYTRGGTYTASVTVTDNEGGTGSNVISIIIDNNPPTAKLAANRTTLYENETVQFDATGSSDLDGNVTDYFYDFGDGEKTAWVQYPYINHTYLEPGTYQATLEIRDDFMVKSVAKAVLTINVLRIKLAPDAHFTAKPDRGTNKTTFSFTSTSSDADGNIVGLKWDFGDGDVEKGGKELTTVGHQYEKPGNYTVILTVTDDDDLEGKFFLNVVVEEIPNILPTLKIKAPVSGTVISADTLDVSGTASDTDGELEYVEIQINELGWVRANGTTVWNYQWVTKDYENGIYNISARSYDGKNWSNIEMINVTLKKGKGGGGGGGGGPGFEAVAMVVALTVAVIVAGAMRRRRS